MTAAPSASQMAETLRDRWKIPDGAKVYVVVDAAQSYEPVVLLRDPLGKSPQSLCQGEAIATLAEVAPYVCPVELDDEFLEMWCGRWGGNQGVLLAASGEADALQSHLRKIFVTQDDAGQECYFRFYDPRVLRSYLPSRSAEELRKFCGPIVSWCTEGEDPASAQLWTLGDEGVQCKTIPLAKPS